MPKVYAVAEVHFRADDVYDAALAVPREYRWIDDDPVGAGHDAADGIVPAKILHGAVRLHGLASSPTPDTQVGAAWA
jgi:hypothetical protein